MRTMVPVLLLLLATLASSLVTRAGEDAEPTVLPSTSLGVRDVLAVRKSSSVVLAHVREVHESPGVWCGIAETSQDVTWQVDHVLDGKTPPDPVRVGHPLVHGSRLVERDEPRLDPKLVHPGACAILCLVQDDHERWSVLDEDFSVRLVRAPEPSSPR